MKTPKRQYTFPIDSRNYPGLRGAFEGEEVPSAHALQCERWKRKNRTAQLKRTIARLTKDLAATREACDYLFAAYIEHERCARALYEHIMRERKNAHKQAENGQQPELPPTGGQQAYVAQNAENAKQETLLCTGAEQLESRKGN